MIKHHTVFVAAAAIFALSISGVGYSVNALGQQPTTSSAQPDNRPRHVFIIVLENQGFETTFGKKSPRRTFLVSSLQRVCSKDGTMVLVTLASITTSR